MMQIERAKTFAALHVKGDPVVLYNIWDAGTARVLAEAGAKALATGSASVAWAQGFEDGQKIPLEWVYNITSQIVANVHVPLSVDFEGGYGVDPLTIAKNVAGLVRAGAVGVNFEDQIVGGSGLHDVRTQAGRIRAVREGAAQSGVPLFINARTDLFLKETDPSRHGALMEEAFLRAAAYERAGADGFFAPGLGDPELIRALCAGVALPVNILTRKGEPGRDVLGSLGVARISYGPGPYEALMEKLAEAFSKIS